MLAQLLYTLYERRLQKNLRDSQMPTHVAVILDGNRRWARELGSPAAHGHQAGADKILEFLGWAEEAGIRIVTLWMLSTDNLVGRSAKELEVLEQIIAATVTDLSEAGRWKIRIVGNLDLFPENFAELMRRAERETDEVNGLEVNVAIGYGGRMELVDAVSSLLKEAAERGRSLQEVAETLTDTDIAAHLYTRGQPDPDLIIRTSGEQRLSGFLLWQSAHSEYYFCETYWPGFRKVDFLRALRSYGQRERRLGK